MRLLGYDITIAKATRPLSTLDSRGGWYPVWPTVREAFTQAWQQNSVASTETVLSYFAVYACTTLISSDIGKMRIKLVAQDANGIWTETESAAFSPVLRKPNRYQNRIKFVEWWIMSKLLHGNTYALKERDARGVVVALYILDPTRVTPLVAPDGSVFYELKRDVLSGLETDTVIVPAREIIHDVGYALYHPLIGVSPLRACSVGAQQGLSIQTASSAFFANGSTPGGVLTAPGAISQDTANRLKTYWEEQYSGSSTGKIAVLGDGLKYEPMTVKAVDAQLIEQLKWTADVVCSAFHVPPYMIGVGPMPNYNNIEALSQQYYSQCLQALIEALELSLDEGLELPRPYGVECDLDTLLRMDTATKVQATSAAIGAGFMSPNEARAKFDLKPVEGGDTPYLQQQNYSLAALNRRDEQVGTAPPTESTPVAGAEPPELDDADDADDAADEDEARDLLEWHVRTAAFGW